MRRRNGRLKGIVFEAGFTQRELARKAKLHESILSQAVNGIYILSESQKRRIARVLGKPTEEVFKD